MIDNLTINSESLANMSAYRGVVFTNGGREIVRILPDGNIIIAPGVDLNEASRVFWRNMEVMLPGVCQRLLEEKKGKP